MLFKSYDYFHKLTMDIFTYWPRTDRQTHIVIIMYSKGRAIKATYHSIRVCMYYQILIFHDVASIRSGNAETIKG